MRNVCSMSADREVESNSTKTDRPGPADAAPSINVSAILVHTASVPMASFASTTQNPHLYSRDSCHFRRKKIPKESSTVYSDIFSQDPARRKLEGQMSVQLRERTIPQ
jgi:hypothetical protein